MARGGDVQQLLLQVDASVALAQRNIRALASSVNQETGKIEQSLERVEQAHARMGKAFNDNGRLRGGLQQLSFQVGDVSQQMAMGTKASTIFVQQSGQVIQALQVMGGEGNKFLQFLGGPWGIVLSTATVILASLGGKLLDSKDAVGSLVEKMREQADQAEKNRQADELWKHTIEGLTEAIRKRREEQEKSLATDIQTEQKALADASRELEELKQKRFNVAKDFNELQSRTGSRNIRGAAEVRLEDLQRQLASLDRQIAIAEANVRGAEAPIAERNVENKLDKVKAATDEYTRALGRLRRELRAGAIDQAKYEAELLAAAKKRDAAIAAANKEKRSSRTTPDADLTSFVSPIGGGTITGTFGEKRPGHTHAGLDLATPVGTSVGAAAAGTVIEVGQLAGYGNVVIIDHGRGTTTRYAHLSKFLVSKGQAVGQGDTIGLSGGAKGAEGAGNSQGPHLHFEVRRGGKAVDPRKASFPTDPSVAGRGAVQSAESAAERAVRQQNAFEESLARLNTELLQTKMELIDDARAQAAASSDQVRLELANRDAALQNDVEEKKLTQAQADALKAKNQEIADQKLKNVEIRKQLRLLQEADALESQTTQFKVDELEYADQIARTQAEHRQLQLEILDLVYQQKQKHLETLKAQAELAGNTAEAARIQAEINDLPNQQSRDRDKVMRGTKDPLEAWGDQVPQTAAEIVEALHSIEAQGLDQLADSITGVLMGTKSLGAAFKEMAGSIIADIIKMTIKMLIFRAISGAFGGGKFGSGGIGGGSMSVGVSSLASPTSYASSNLGNFNFGSLPGFATGGSFMLGGNGGIDNNVLSINGAPVAKVSQGERLDIVPRSPRVRVPRGGGAGGNTTLTVNVHARDAVLTSQVKSWVAEGIFEAAPHIVRAARENTVRSLTRTKLPG